MASSILVIALNPSMDVEWRVSHVAWEEKNSILSERRWAGGKGVNVARWLTHLGQKTRLLLPAGGQMGLEFTRALEAGKLSARVVNVGGQTRANIVVTTNEGRQLRFNPLGPKISAHEWNQFRDAMRAQLRYAKFAILSGSVAPGLPQDAYRELIEIAHIAGVVCLLDCDGAPFAEAIRAHPFLVKPNVHELEQWSGLELRSRAAILKAAKALSTRTGKWVLLSRGKNGALLLNSTLGKAFEAPALRVPVQNTVAAGDAMLAGVALAMGKKLAPEMWLRWGIACGGAAVSRAAGILPSRAQIKTLFQKTHLTSGQ